MQCVYCSLCLLFKNNNTIYIEIVFLYCRYSLENLFWSGVLYLCATLLCWSPQSIGARFLMPGKATCLPVCYPAVLVIPEHWSKVPHAR